MPETVQKEILNELKAVKAKVFEMDKEIHKLREDFADSHMSEDDRNALGEALEDERKGENISLAEMRKRLRI